MMWSTLPVDFQQALLRIVKLPTLKTLDLTKGITFPDPASFCNLFSNASSHITALAFSCLAFENPRSRIPVDMAPVHTQAKIANLELNYIESDIHGPAVISMLSSPQSPFNITGLESLSITGIATEDLWIETLLSLQSDPRQLKHVLLHDIHQFGKKVFQAAFLDSN